MRLQLPKFHLNYTKLTGGAILGQLFSLTFTYLVVRFFSTEDIGDLTLFNSVVSPVVLAATLRLEIGIVVPKEEVTGKQLTALAVLLGQLTALLAGLFLGIALLISPKFLPELRFLALLVSVSVSMLTFKIVLTFWLLRKSRYDALSILRIAEAICVGGMPLLFVYNANGLIIGTVVGHLLLAVVFLLVFLNAYPIKEFLFGWKQLWTTLKSFKEFPMHNLPQSVVDVLQLSGLVYVVSLYFDATKLGYLYLAFRILEAPIGLLIAPLSQLFLQSASQASHEGKPLAPLVRSTLIRAFVLTIGIIPVFFFWGEPLVALLKEEMREAGKVIAILSFWYFTDYLKASIIQVAVLLKKQKELLIYSCFRTLLSLSVLAYFGSSYSFTTTLIAISATISVCNIFLVIWLQNAAKK